MAPDARLVASLQRLQPRLLGSATSLNVLATAGARVVVVSDIRELLRIEPWFYDMKAQVYGVIYGSLVALNLYAFAGARLSFAGVRPLGVVILGLITSFLVFAAVELAGHDSTRYGSFLRALAVAGVLLSASLAIVASVNARTNRSDAD